MFARVSRSILDPIAPSLFALESLPRVNPCVTVWVHASILTRVPALLAILAKDVMWPTVMAYSPICQLFAQVTVLATRQIIVSVPLGMSESSAMCQFVTKFSEMTPLCAVEEASVSLLKCACATLALLALTAKL